MKIRNILLIVEGERTEVDVFNRIGSLFFDKKTKFQFYVYGTNLYSLYKKIKKDAGFTSTIGVLKEMPGNSDSKKILNLKFSEIYLIFDYDPQEPAYSDKKITELISIFNDEYEFGKLYINYPMMESMNDHNKFNIEDYVNRTVNLEGLTSDSYKCYIRENGYKKSINNFTTNHFKKLTKMNIIKAFYMIKHEKRFPDYKEYLYRINQQEVLKIQITSKNEQSKFYVLNTCMFFLVDYFGEKYYKDL